MLFGEPPFLCADKKELFKKIVTERLKIDKKKLTPEAVDLLKGLMEKNPLKRLGADSISTVKNHIFFKDTDWDSVLERKEKMPQAYLSQMALKIVQDEPYVAANHPSTRGMPCTKESAKYFRGWSFARK
jgi:serine/threonine protein kinase